MEGGGPALRGLHRMGSAWRRRLDSRSRSTPHERPRCAAVVPAGACHETCPPVCCRRPPAPHISRAPAGARRSTDRGSRAEQARQVAASRRPCRPGKSLRCVWLAATLAAGIGSAHRARASRGDRLRARSSPAASAACFLGAPRLAVCGSRVLTPALTHSDGGGAERHRACVSDDWARRSGGQSR